MKQSVKEARAGLIPESDFEPKCARCGSPLKENGRCSEVCCNFFDYQQGDPRGWEGHPSPPPFDPQPGDNKFVRWPIDSRKAFDLEKVYDEEISPLMDQIIALCQKWQIPMLCTFLYKYDPDGDHPDGDYCTTAGGFHREPLPDEMKYLISKFGKFAAGISFTSEPLLAITVSPAK